MSVVNKRKIQYGPHNILQLEIRGEDEVEYRKNVPQSEDIWLSLNIRKDGSKPHIYLHESGGREINKQNPILVPQDCLYGRTLDAGEEWRNKWPNDAGSCVVTAFYPSSHLDIDIKHEDDERILIPSGPVDKMYLVFVDKKNRPIPREVISYY